VARDDEFAAFVAARYRTLVRTGLLLTGDTGHAADLTQSALIRTYLAWESFWLWNGRAVLTGNVGSYGRLGRVAAWDPRSRRWFTLAAAPGRPALSANPLWAGYRLLLLSATGNLLTFHS
jgi:hypothetical protein